MFDRTKYLSAREADVLFQYKGKNTTNALAKRAGVRIVKDKHQANRNLYDKRQLIRAFENRNESQVSIIEYVPQDFKKCWRLKGDFMVICDAHCPFVDFDFFQDRVLRVRDELGISELILAGDTLNCSAFSKFYGMFKQPWEDEKRVAREFLALCCMEFDKVWLLSTNHELRYMRKLWVDYDRRVLAKGATDLWQSVTGEMAPAIKERLRFSVFSHCTINEDAKYGWKICHPNVARKIPASYARDQAAIEFKNIIVAHAHMSGWVPGPNKDVVLIDCGVFASPKYFDYKQLQDTAHFNWSESFVAIKDNEGRLYMKGKDFSIPS